MQSETETETDVADDGGHGVILKLARLLFGVAVGYATVTNFKDMEGSIGYAQSKNVPNAETLVPFASGMGTVGSLGLILWRAPVLSAGAVFAYLVGVTAFMHDFWNIDDEMESQNELYHFLKNVGLIGGALAFLIHAGKK
ncbi:hypothetical protein AUR64_07075 [Haloprofundus marisrubri]|uniref:DoxX family protein n=2 Tax=Haloprofundus marisrubri TaxID=1514971 RepID=A0A0W1RCG0_9EURY|nr:hypothetical protein AUR64_07075 [Haloprofundus marisrubri]